MASQIKIAEYVIALGSKGSQQVLVLVPKHSHQSLPLVLGAVVAPLEPGKPLAWQAHKLSVAPDVSGEGSVVIDENKSPVTIQYIPLVDGLKKHQQALGRTLPALASLEDVVEAALKGIETQYGRYYPEAVYEPEDDRIVITSPTAFPSRVGDGAKPAAKSAAPKRAKGADRIKVWL